MDIRIERVPQADGVELAVVGRLDAESASELRHAVAAEVRRGEHRISLDLAGVTFLSSAGIRVLFETQREARSAGAAAFFRKPVDAEALLDTIRWAIRPPAPARVPAG